jgi:hypothetical protein
MQPKEAEVAASLAAFRVSRDHIVIPTDAVPESFASASQRIVRQVHNALLGIHVKTSPHLVEHRVELGRGNPRHAVVSLPFLPGPRRRSEAGHPVDRRAPARGLAGQDIEREIFRRQDAVALEHRIVGVGFPPREIGRAAIGTGLEDDDPMARLGELRGDDRPPGTASDHADIRIERGLRRRTQAFAPQSRWLAGPCTLSGVGGAVAYRGPVRILSVLEGFRVREEQDETLHRMEAAPLQWELTPRPSEEVPLPRPGRHRRKAPRRCGQQQVEGGTLQGLEEPPETPALGRADVGLDDPRDVRVDPHVARRAMEESIRIRGPRQSRDERVGDQAQRSPLVRGQPGRTLETHAEAAGWRDLAMVLPTPMGACIYPRPTSRDSGSPCPSTKPLRRT